MSTDKIPYLHVLRAAVVSSNDWHELANSFGRAHEGRSCPPWVGAVYGGEPGYAATDGTTTVLVRRPSSRKIGWVHFADRPPWTDVEPGPPAWPSSAHGELAVELPAGKDTATLLAWLAAATRQVRWEYGDDYPWSGVRGERACIVVTDGHRLHHEPRASSAEWHLRPAAAEAVARAAKAQPRETVQVYATDVGTVAVCGEVVVSSAKIEGEYPDWQRTVPKVADVACRVSPEVLRTAHQQAVKALRADKHTLWGVLWTTADGVLRVSSRPDDKGTTFGPIEVPIDGTLPSRLFFNARYILDVLVGFTADVLLDASNPPYGPLRLTDGSGRYALVMPANL